MNVLFLADAVFEDKPGGSRVVARELARRLTARGHAVTFLVARHDLETPADERTAAHVRVVRYDGAGRPSAFVRAGRAACARLLSEQPFDIVHTHFAYAAVGPLQVVPRNEVPHVRSFYGPWDTEGWVEDMARAGGKSGPIRVAHLAKACLKRRLRHTVEAANLRRSDRTLVLSEQSRGEVRAFGYPDARLVFAPGGVDTERFRPAEDKAAVRRTLGLPEDRTLLLSVRRLAPRMGLDNLILALPEIVRLRPNTLLVIGGIGPERERLERLARDTGLTNHVRFTGFLPDDQLAAYYQAADLFVLPTLALEGFGLVTVEALACGTPVVGTPVGATPEILHGLDERLVTSGTSPNALAAGVLDFLTGDWGRALIPERMNEFVQTRYTWERHADAVEALYHDLLAARTRSARSGSLRAAAVPEKTP